MRNTKNAFTLVELIVVITILAILGTIAFISLQGYSADARNSKRTSDLGNIQSAISLKQVEGVPLMSFVTGVPASTITGIDLAGATAIPTDTTKYNAGTPAYTVLNVVAKDFKDPQDNQYAIAATTFDGGVFQVAATMEVDGNDQALVNGTFNARTTQAYSGTTVGDVFTLDDANANTFKLNDTTNLGTVTKVSRDGVTLTIAGLTGTPVSIALANDEDKGLIQAVRANGTTVAPAAGTAVVNGSGATLAY